MSLAASETQLSLWSPGSAPLILGGDLASAVTNACGSKASLTRRDLSLLENRQVIEVDQDAIDASRIVGAGSPGNGAGHQVLAKREPGGDAIAGLFNTTTSLSSKAVTISVTAKALAGADRGRDRHRRRAVRPGATSRWRAVSTCRSCWAAGRPTSGPGSAAFPAGR